MSNLLKVRIRRAFSRCAPRYDHNARLQQETARLLAEQLAAGVSPAPPGIVLDVGTGTAGLAELVLGVFPGARVVGCDMALGMLKAARAKQLERFALAAGDAEGLPFAAVSFDLLVSSLTYQWMEDLESALAEAFRVLKPRGRLFIASLGPDSLWELRRSFTLAYLAAKGREPDYLQDFYSPSCWEEQMLRAGFRGVKALSRPVCQVYPNPLRLLVALRNIGAVNASAARPRGLASRRILQQMEAVYQQRYAVAGGVAATYEIVWAQGVKP